MSLDEWSSLPDCLGAVQHIILRHVDRNPQGLCGRWLLLHPILWFRVMQVVQNLDIEFEFTAASIFKCSEIGLCLGDSRRK